MPIPQSPEVQPENLRESPSAQPMLQESPAEPSVRSELQALQSAVVGKTEKRAGISEQLRSLAQQQREIEQEVSRVDRELQSTQTAMLLQEKEVLMSRLQSVNVLRTQAIALQKELQESMLDTITDTTKSVVDDIAHPTGMSMVKYAVAGVAGGYLVHKVASWILGTKEKPTLIGRFFGSIGRGAKWLATLGGVALGAVGLKFGMDRFGSGTGGGIFGTQEDDQGKTRLTGMLDRSTPNSIPFVPQSAENVIEGGAEGGVRAAEDINKYLGSAATALIDHENTMKVWNERSNYASNSEFCQAMALAIIKDGGSLVFDEGLAFLSIGGKLLSLDGEFGGQLYNFVTTGEIDIGDMVSTYVEGALLYATSLAALKILTLGRYAKGSYILMEAAGWPIFTVRRIVMAPVSGVMGASKFGYEIIHPNGMRLNISRVGADLNRGAMRMSSLFGVSAEGLETRIATIEKLETMVIKAQSFPRENIEAFEKTLAKSKIHLQKYVQALAKKNALPEWFTKKQTELYGGRTIRSLTMKEIETIAQANPVSRSGGIVTAEVVGVKPPIVAGGAPVQATAVLRTMSSWDIGQMNIRLARFHASAATPAKVTEALQKIGTLDEGLITAINSSDDVARSFVTLLDAADDPLKALTSMNKLFGCGKGSELTTLIASDKGALARLVTDIEKGVDVPKVLSKWAVASKLLTAGGIVLNGLAVYASIAEAMDAEDRITALRKRGGNDALESAYREQQMINAAQAGIGVVGMASGGIVLLGVGGTAGALAGPVALATLPISAVLYGGYQGNQWKQQKARTIDDMRAEGRTPSDVITELRDYGIMTKGVGHLWDAEFDDWRWVLYASGAAGSIYNAVSRFTGEGKKQYDSLINDIKTDNRKKIELIAADTSMIRKPIDREATGQEKNALKAYVEAKTDHIMNQSKSIFAPINAGANILLLLQEADAIGQIAYKESMYASTPEKDREPLPQGWPDPSLPAKERAATFAVLEKKGDIQSIFAAAVMGIVMAPEENVTNEKGSSNRFIAMHVAQQLLKAEQLMQVRFQVNCMEENFKDWLPDGDAQAVVQVHVMDAIEKIIDTKKTDITSSLFADIAAMQKDGTGGGHILAIRNLTDATNAVEREMHDAMFTQRPKEIWLGMSDVEKAQAREKITLAQKDAEARKKSPENVEQPKLAA